MNKPKKLNSSILGITSFLVLILVPIASKASETKEMSCAAYSVNDNPLTPRQVSSQGGFGTPIVVYNKYRLAMFMIVDSKLQSEPDKLHYLKTWHMGGDMYFDLYEGDSAGMNIQFNIAVKKDGSRYKGKKGSYIATGSFSLKNEFDLSFNYSCTESKRILAKSN